MNNSVRVERKGLGITMIFNWLSARSVINGSTAAALYDVFKEFDRDDIALVAVSCGYGGTFCARDDLKILGTTEANVVHSSVPADRWDLRRCCCPNR